MARVRITEPPNTALRGDSRVTRTPSARKSLGEFKPVMVVAVDSGRTAPDGRPIIHKRTEVIGTSYDGADPNGGMKLGRFGRYRGVTYTNRTEATAHAARYIEELEKREAAALAKRRGQKQGRLSPGPAGQEGRREDG